MHETFEGFLTIDEGRALTRYAMGHRAIEVGVWKGRSTAAIAIGAEHVLAIDTFLGDDDTGRAHTLPEAFHNVEVSGMLSRITLVCGNFFDLLPCLDLGAFGFAHYDADHSGDCTRRALQVFTALPPSAVLAMHDYDPAQFPHVVDAVDTYGASLGWRIAEIVDRMAFLQRC